MSLPVPHLRQFYLYQISIHLSRCIGCGACENLCPARPFSAIYIEGNPVHQEAKPFQEAEKKEVILDDFGF